MRIIFGKTGNGASRAAPCARSQAIALLGAEGGHGIGLHCGASGDERGDEGHQEEPEHYGSKGERVVSLYMEEQRLEKARGEEGGDEADREMKAYIARAHAVIAAALPKRKQAELGL